MSASDYERDDQERIRKVLQISEEDVDISNEWEFEFLDNMFDRIAVMEEAEGAEAICDSWVFTPKQIEKIDELAHKYLRGD